MEARAHAPLKQACGLQGRPAWNRIGTEGLRARAHSISEAIAALCAEPPTRPQTKRLSAPWKHLWAWLGTARAAIKNVARSRQFWKRAACAPGANASPSRCDPLGRASGREGCTKGRTPFWKRSRQTRLSPRCAPTASNSCAHGARHGAGLGPRAERFKSSTASRALEASGLWSPTVPTAPQTPPKLMRKGVAERTCALPRLGYILVSLRRF